jgi:hypothetical protein
MIYKKTKDVNGNLSDVIKKTVDGATVCIPPDEANTDYQEYLEWVAEGNTAEAAD